MKSRAYAFTFLICLMAGALCFAASDAQMGTWKLNESKSKLSPAAPKNETVIYEAAGDNVKITLEGTAPDGSKRHTEWTGKFDGKDYPSTGNPMEDMRSYKEVNARTLDVVSKKDGKVLLTGRVVISKDGKTRTTTITGTDASGKKYKSVAVYDKQ
jgi:hypothetical protein